MIRYNSNVDIKHGDNVPLNGDHTHFIMIDDGSRYRFFGKSTDFITRFETMVRDQEPTVSLLPIVQAFIESTLFFQIFKVDLTWRIRDYLIIQLL